MKNFIFVLCFIISATAFAYIPSSAFVFDRVTALHGKGAYRISTEVSFKEGAELQVVKETWIINDGGEMIVQAVGDGFKLTRLLKRGKVHWVDQNNSEHASEVPTDYYMQALLMRTPLELKKYFVKWGALSSEALKDKWLPKDPKAIKTETESFVHLGRVNGAIQLAYGAENGEGPGVWIEQDHFFISKMRAPSGAEFLGQDYVIYARGLAFPKTQTLSYDSKKVEIKVTSVVGIDLSPDQKKMMEPTWLRSRPENTTTWPQHSLASLVQDFYKRFR